MSQTIEIRGCRIRLRDWKLEDLPAWKHWQQPHHEWYRYDGPWWGPPRVETIEGKIEEQRRTILDADWPVPRKQMVIVDLATDRFIGTTNWNWEGKETNWRSVGIGIYDPRNWGKGLGFEALGLWTEYLFDSLPEIVRLGLHTWSGNVWMIGLAKKLGYLEEACFRRARIVDGEYYDSVAYGVLREEWKDRHPNGFAADALRSTPRSPISVGIRQPLSRLAGRRRGCPSVSRPLALTWRIEPPSVFQLSWPGSSVGTAGHLAMSRL